MCIVEFARQPTAEQCREELKADRKLAEMDLFADLAELYETEQSPRLRQRFADRYRRLIGVHPEQRKEFRAALERVLAGGGMPVEDVIDLINRDHEKRSGFACRADS